MSIRFSPVECQGNYAATVRVIMPFGSNAGRAAGTGAAAASARA